MSFKNLSNKNAFQWDAYRLLQWPFREGGCLTRVVSAWEGVSAPRGMPGPGGCLVLEGVGVFVQGVSAQGEGCLPIGCLSRGISA